MKFYVPIMDEESHRFWNLIQSLLFCEGRFTTDRRIQSLLWEGNAADPRSVIVGEDLPGGDEDDPVMVIHESSFFPDTMMFACTLAMFMERRPPVALAVSEHVRVVEFDEG
jgi:hypothetical protein